MQVNDELLNHIATYGGFVMNRLQQIKTDWTEETETYKFRQLTLENEDIEWLIKQAEKAEKLEKLRNIVANAHQETLEKKDKEIERYEKAMNEALEICKWESIKTAKIIFRALNNL
jgi:hypothetical protein